MALTPALVAAIGGQATPEECGLITDPLYIRGARDLEGIEHFTNVESVELLGCDLGALDAFTTMPKLRMLRVLCTSVTDISALRRCERLVEVELNFTLVEDISPLLEVPNLHWVRLFGNPLSIDSYDRVLPRLQERVVDAWRKPPIVEVSPRKEWQIARKIKDARLAIAFGSVPRSGTYSIVRPGVGGEGRPVDFLQAGFDFMEKTLAEDPKFAEHAMFHKFFTQDWVDQSLSRFRAQWLAGNHRDAYEWVDANVKEESQRSGYFNFISRFNRELFFVETAERLAGLEAVHKVQFPEWWKRLRHWVLAGVRPHESSVQLRFNAFESESITRKQGVYKVGWLGYYNPGDRALFLDRCGMFPIGDIASQRDLGNSMLAINVRQPDDPRIYEFWPRSLYHAVDEGRNPMELIMPVFSSCATMLSYVAAIIVGDEIVAAV
jgi:hypothetical protein